MNKKTVSFLLTFLVVIFSYHFLPQTKEESSVRITPSPTTTIDVSTHSARVLRVIDGDTIELENKQKVRYIGIDTPELHDPRRPVECFGREAYEMNKSLVEGKRVILEKDISETDKYKRLLRYVYLPVSEKETTASGLMINDYLVREGYAHAVSYPPDLKYQEQFKNGQKEASNSRRGFWNSCPVN